jgi:hypothetical protein
VSIGKTDRERLTQQTYGDWGKEHAAVKKYYPDFSDLSKSSLADAAFLSLLKNGVSGSPGNISGGCTVSLPTVTTINRLASEGD